jgi:hypothetical protein
MVGNFYHQPPWAAGFYYKRIKQYQLKAVVDTKPPAGLMLVINSSCLSFYMQARIIYLIM